MMRRTILAVVVAPVPLGLRSAVAAGRITDATGARIAVPERIAGAQPGGGGR